MGGESQAGQLGGFQARQGHFFIRCVADALLSAILYICIWEHFSESQMRVTLYLWFLWTFTQESEELPAVQKLEIDYSTYLDTV